MLSSMKSNSLAGSTFFGNNENLPTSGVMTDSSMSSSPQNDISLLTLLRCLMAFSLIFLSSCGQRNTYVPIDSGTLKSILCLPERALSVDAVCRLLSKISSNSSTDENVKVPEITSSTAYWDI